MRQIPFRRSAHGFFDLVKNVVNFSIILSLFFALFDGLILKAQSPNEAVLATIGNKKISLGDFNKKFSEVRKLAINPPTRHEFLEDLIRFEVGLQEAEKQGLEKDSIVQDRMRQELYKALLEKELGQKVQHIKVEDKDMREYYKKNPDIRLSHILIEVKVSATLQQRDEARKRAEEILLEVKKSKRPFEELVKLYSDDALSKQAGGDVGWQSRVTLFPSYYDSVLKLKDGQLSGLIESPYGFHIVKLTGKRTYEAADKRALRTAVFDFKRKELFDEYFVKAKKNYSIKVNSKLID